MCQFKSSDIWSLLNSDRTQNVQEGLQINPTLNNVEQRWNIFLWTMLFFFNLKSSVLLISFRFILIREYESDIYRRQIMTYKDDPHAERCI